LIDDWMFNYDKLWADSIASLK